MKTFPSQLSQLDQFYCFYPLLPLECVNYADLLHILSLSLIKSYVHNANYAVIEANQLPQSLTHSLVDVSSGTVQHDIAFVLYRLPLENILVQLFECIRILRFVFFEEELFVAHEVVGESVEQSPPAGVELDEHKIFDFLFGQVLVLLVPVGGVLLEYLFAGAVGIAGSRESNSHEGRQLHLQNYHVQTVIAQVFSHQLQISLLLLVVRHQLLLFFLIGSQNSTFGVNLLFDFTLLCQDISQSSGQCFSFLFLVVDVAVPLEDAVLLFHYQKLHPLHLALRAFLQQLQIASRLHGLHLHASQQVLLLLSFDLPALQLLQQGLQLIALPLVHFTRLFDLLLFRQYFDVELLAVPQVDVLLL